MYKSKLFDVLRYLPESELEKFATFLPAQLVCDNEDLRILYDYLLKNKIWNDPQKAEKKHVFQYLFPGKPYKDLVLRKMMSDLLQKIELFMAFRDLMQKPQKIRQHALAFYRVNHLNKHFDNHLRFLEKELEHNEIQDEEYFLDTYQLMLEYNQFVANQKSRSFPRKYQEMATAVDLFYVIKKLKFACSLLTHQRISAKEYELPLLKEIIELAQEEKYKEVAVIELYTKMVKIILREEDEMAFKDLKALLLVNASKIALKDAKELYIYAFNYCVQQANAGKIHYLEELFALYKQALQGDYMLVDNALSPWNYKNIITVGLRLKDYDWVYQFIHEYKNKIGGKEPENAYTYNLARYYFSVQNYKKVLQLLQMVEYSDVFYQLDSKALLLKAYYETDEIESLFSLMDSFKQLLRRRNSISDHHRTNYLNLIRFVKRLCKINPRDKKKREQLRVSIEGSKQIADKNWLLEKLETMR